MTIGFLRDFHSISMIFLWDYYGISKGMSMVFPWDSCGVSVVFP